MDAKKTINDVLVHLFNEILELEENAIISEEYKDITNNDMHIIEQIGLGQGQTMSNVAKSLRITAGSLTTSVNSLVKKGYVTRDRSEEDRRVVYIALTPRGVSAYHHHERFHQKMVESVMAYLDGAELEVLTKTLDRLSIFFREYRKN